MAQGAHAFVLRESYVINPFMYSNGFIRGEIRRLTSSIRELRYGIERLKVIFSDNILRVNMFEKSKETEKTNFMKMKSVYAAKDIFSNMKSQISCLRRVSQDLNILLERQYNVSVKFSEGLEQRIKMLKDLTIRNSIRRIDPKKGRKEISAIKKHVVKKADHLRKKLNEKSRKIDKAAKELAKEAWRKSKRQLTGYFIFKEALNNSTIDSISTKLKAGVKEAVIGFAQERESIKRDLKMRDMAYFEKGLERLYEIEMAELLSLHKSLDENKVLISKVEDDLKFVEGKSLPLHNLSDFSAILNSVKEWMASLKKTLEKQSRFAHHAVAA